MICKEPAITTAEISQALGITAKGVEWQVRNLKQTGHLIRLGPAKGGHWKVIEMPDGGKLAK